MTRCGETCVRRCCPRPAVGSDGGRTNFGARRPGPPAEGLGPPRVRAGTRLRRRRQASWTSGVQMEGKRRPASTAAARGRAGQLPAQPGLGAAGAHSRDRGVWGAIPSGMVWEAAEVGVRAGLGAKPEFQPPPHQLWDPEQVAGPWHLGCLSAHGR